VKLLQNKTLEGSHLLFSNIRFKQVLKFLEKNSGRSNVFIISTRQSSLSNKFCDKNQTLQTEVISDIVRIDGPDWLVLYQIFIVINYICD